MFKPRARVRKPVAAKQMIDQNMPSEARTVPHLPDASISAMLSETRETVEIDTATLAQAVTCISDAETLDEMCTRIAEANKAAHTPLLD